MMLTPPETVALWDIASGRRVARNVRRRLEREGFLDAQGMTEKAFKAVESVAPRCKWEPPKQQGPVEHPVRQLRGAQSIMMLSALTLCSLPALRRK